MSHQVVWVDIPVTHLDRAVAFYAALLAHPVTKAGGEGMVFGLLPHAESGVSGCLVETDTANAPSRSGPLIYLNADGRIRQAVDAAKANGGQVVRDVHPIGPHGFRAILIDSEGNRIAIHSQTD